MRVALFAADDVGAEIVELFAERGVRPDFLVLDSRDRQGLNAVMRHRVQASQVILSDELLQESTLQTLRDASLDLGILAWWPYLVKEPLLGMAKLGYLNFHPSLLPYNRGKHPNFWSLVEGTPYGVTLHFIDAGIDSGDVAYQRAIATDWEDTGKTLHEKGKRALVELFREHFDEILKGKAPRRRQNLLEGNIRRAKELDPASEIDLDGSYSGRALLNLLRARTYPPHPGAWFRDGDQRFEVRVEIRKLKE